MSWNLSRSNIRKHPEIKLGKEYEEPQEKMNSTLSLFFKIHPMYRQTAGKPLPSQAPTSLCLITGSHSRPVTQHLNRENSPG